MGEQVLTKKGKAKWSKYDDWVCLRCHNHNYSFRVQCNRCQLQTKQQNSYLVQHQRQLLESQPPPTLKLQEQLVQLSSQITRQFFPNVLLLVVNNDPWEETFVRKDSPESDYSQWVNALIED